MSLHQNAFLTRPKGEVDTVALRALAILTTNKSKKVPTPESSSNINVPLHSETLMQQLYEASLSSDQIDVGNVIRDMRQANVSVEQIISDFIPAAARKLGQDWVDDRTSFGAVTIGCARLQANLHHLEGNFSQSHMRHPQDQPRCLVIAPEGAQHTLGGAVLSTQLRQAGSHVQFALGVGPEKMARLAGSERFDAIMISAALGQDLDILRALVRASRASKHDAKVVIGGGLVEHCHDLAEQTEADDVSNVWQDVINLSPKGLPRRQSAL